MALTKAGLLALSHAAFVTRSTSGSWPNSRASSVGGGLRTHHLRFAQHRALGRKASDEFTVPLCRGHHRDAHRCGDEAAWWKNAGVDPTIAARALWLETHPLIPGTVGHR